MLIREIMHPDPVIIQPDTTLCDAYALMQEKNFRHLPVVSEGKLVGVVTDRDLRLATSRLAKRPFDPKDRVKEVMSHPVQTAHPNDPVERAAQLMRELKIGCLPVVEEGEVVGIVTAADMLDALLRLTGIHFPSGRLDISLPDRPGEIARLTSLLAERNINIHSILTYTNEPAREARLVLRVNTMDIRQLAKDLCDAGFNVLWPPHILCVE
ncbi:MAG TPA: CBS domain-containing protein [Caldithrix abyssi]|uniref:CBS domain-containing protein n=1 Tax=Caldithrix abyssi TaxID=187145 RepID=A0A7V5PP07_CALAY|nr:CBS domain-containing protein [Caldithrix abyssi]